MSVTTPMMTTIGLMLTMPRRIEDRPSMVARVG